LCKFQPSALALKRAADAVICPGRGQTLRKSGFTKHQFSEFQSIEKMRQLMSTAGRASDDQKLWNLQLARTIDAVPMPG
jgi:hypothetical protein